MGHSVGNAADVSENHVFFDAHVHYSSYHGDTFSPKDVANAIAYGNAERLFGR